jgi:hypothetical protein
MRLAPIRTVPFSLAAFLSTLATALVAEPAVAQYALDAPSGSPTVLSPGARVRGAVGARRLPGTGGALDANLSVTDGPANQAAQKIDFNARNLVVTNNVAGGRGFRGSVGYRADTDFRGRAGSDDLFRWEAYSAESNPVWVQTVRSADQFQIAQGIGQFEYRRATTPIDTIPSNQPMASRPDARLRLDRQNSALNLGSVVQLNAEPVDFAQGLDARNNQVNYVVSPIQGMRMEKVADPLTKSGLSLYEKAIAREEIADGRIMANTAQQSFISPLSRNAATDAMIQPTPIGDESAGDAYERIVRDVIRAYADVPNVNVNADPRVVEEVRKELEVLRGTLRGTVAPAEKPPLDVAPDPTAPPEPGIDPRTGLPMAPERPAEVDSTVPGESTLSTEEQEAVKQELLNAEAIRRLAENLRHGSTVSDLSPGDRARVDQLVRSGQDNIDKGEFFTAERCFADALALNSGNPLLIAGLGNSQLGAGLYLSAALTFRELFTSYPEMIDTRYEVRLLPREARLRQAVDALRERISGKTDADSFGLLLAYLGHQLEDRGLINEGLGVVTGNPANDAMRMLLQEVWLADRSRTDVK